MKRLALRLLEWHGGQSSGLYSVGSTLLADCMAGRKTNWKTLRPSVERAIYELRGLRKYANHPECVTEKDEAECNALASRLERKLA